MTRVILGRDILTVADPKNQKSTELIPGSNRGSWSHNRLPTLFSLLSFYEGRLIKPVLCFWRGGLTGLPREAIFEHYKVLFVLRRLAPPGVASSRFWGLREDRKRNRAESEGIYVAGDEPASYFLGLRQVRKLILPGWQRVVILGEIGCL